MSINAASGSDKHNLNGVDVRWPFSGRVNVGVMRCTCGAASLRDAICADPGAAAGCQLSRR